MSRLITLFTGQWADLPCETIIEKAKSFGYDGVEFGCWGIILKSARPTPSTALTNARCSTSTV